MASSRPEHDSEALPLGASRDARSLEASPLRVAHSHRIWLPQTETWLYTQLRFLPRDIESHVICQETRNLDQFGLPHIHAMGPASGPRVLWDRYGRRLLGRPYPAHVLRAARSVNAAVLHSHFGPVGWEDLGVARRLALPQLVTFYGVDVNRVPVEHPKWRLRYGELFGAVRRVLCEGPHMAAAISALGCPHDKIQVHHLGVDLAALLYEPRSWRPTEPLRVLLAASFREKKGLTYALQALGRLQAEVALEITIIGDAGPEEDSRREKTRILEVIAQHGLGPRLRLLGYQPHQVLLREAYRHHVFLSPSVTAGSGDTEGGAPFAIAEMAATGMPVVSTTHCDIPELFPSSLPKLLAPERDVDGLLRHLRWLVEHPSRWPALSDASRSWIEQQFDVRVQGRRLARIYHELCRP
jgi:colanic acid/amylovoran/stewartan biosynthesis glycosyltransferase WcaL/AmsK/CpsK